ncbi:MAG TPA: DNA mismatch repair endonuclease MutL [Blastocatellia bacterium]|nr:DNA mismatch repair endonuclease MutL [Blastocatellia bacterium]
MSKIRVLPDQLANQIAAGEVVERPASIVKELIENSIDAGAKSITVDIESGGRRLIRVSDDAEGMTRDDAILAFERHATSKLKSAADLEAILTLGFRGEALASIAAVSKVKLRTQTDQDIIGTEVEISGGKMYNVRDIAFTRGTEIEVRDLFFNVPARRKFLKSEATESFHIANLITHYALANPELAFILRNNGRESISTVPVNSLRERAYQLFGGEFINSLIEVNGELNDLRVSGFVSSPSVVRTNRDTQYFFVNGRYVRDRLLGRALSEAYRAMMPAGVYPSAMLFVELPPQDVDVNVHPAKTEVRFVRSTLVHDTVRDAVRVAIGAAKAAVTPISLPSPFESPRLSIPKTTQPLENVSRSFETNDSSTHRDASRLTREEMLAALTLQQPSSEPEIQEASAPTLEPPKSGLRLPQSVPTQQRINLLQEMALNEKVTDYVTNDEEVQEQTQTSVPVRYGMRIGCLGTRGPEDKNSPLKVATDLTLNAEDVNPMGQLHNSFIIAVDRNGFLLIDQHVAHERILFEQHWRALNRKRVEVQGLLIPETLDLSPAQAAAFDQLSPELEENGFEIGRLSGRTIAIKAVPAALPPAAAQSLLISLLDAIEPERRGLTMDELRAEIAAGLACRAAIKINMQLAPEKMRWLIDELLKTDNPATCPHGRPIILRITSREIERAFQRS